MLGDIVMMDKKKMGKFIKELREERGIAQWELADKIGVKRPTVTKWEIGMVKVREAYLVILSEFFDVTVEELINGERRKKTLTDKIDETTINLLKKVKQLNKLLIYVIVLMIIMGISFLAYYFYISYNEIKVYTVYLDSDKYIANYGLLTKTKEKIYFYLDVDYLLDDDEEIELIQLYYDNGNKRNFISQIDNIQPFIFVAFNGYDEYINFEEFDVAIERMKIDVNFTDGTYETVEVKFDRDYSNSNLFPKKEQSMDTKLNTTKAKEQETKFYDRFLKLKKVIEKYGKDNKLKFEFEEKEFTLEVFDDELTIEFYIDDVKYNYRYIYINREQFYLNILDDRNNEKQIYSFDIQKGKCLEGDCTDHMTNYRQMLRLYYEIMYVYKK